MLIAYRPELENPPREAGFGIITDKGLISLAPGLNQEIPDEQWDLAKANSTVQALLKIGAIEELKERVEVETIPQGIDSQCLMTIQACSHINTKVSLNGLTQLRW